MNNGSSGWFWVGIWYYRLVASGLRWVAVRRHQTPGGSGTGLVVISRAPSLLFRVCCTSICRDSPVSMVYCWTECARVQLGRIVRHAVGSRAGFASVLRADLTVRLRRSADDEIGANASDSGGGQREREEAGLVYCPWRFFTHAPMFAGIGAPFGLSLSKGNRFVLRQAQHERNSEPLYSSLRDNTLVDSTPSWHKCNGGCIQEKD